MPKESYPQELLDFYSDSEAWSKTNDPEVVLASVETKEIFLGHISRLQPLADGGNDYARYAIATIYLFELVYSDTEARDKKIEQDREVMTDLLYQCAMNGMGIAFDNLVTCGTGEIGDSARVAAKEYEINNKPEIDQPSGMPVYSPNWMEGAMGHWKEKIENKLRSR